jgi:hypothetical protein
MWTAPPSTGRLPGDKAVAFAGKLAHRLTSAPIRRQESLSPPSKTPPKFTLQKITVTDSGKIFAECFQSLQYFKARNTDITVLA